MNISPAPVPNQFRDADGNILKLSIFAIGNWDMTANLFHNIDVSPLVASDIRMVVICIDNNTSEFYFKSNTYTASDGTRFLWSSFGSPTGNSITIEQATLTTDPEYGPAVGDKGTVFIWHKI